MEDLSKVKEAITGSEPTSDTQEEDVNVLVVDDEEVVAEMHRDWVSEEGYPTEVAYGGEDALWAVDEETDIILLDRRMPGINGDQVLEALRSDDIDVVDAERFEDDEVVVDEIDWDMDIRLETARVLDEEVVKELQSKEVDPLVCVVTAIHPSFRVIEMEFDHYLTKNVEKEDLVGAIQSLVVLEEFGGEGREYHSLLRKKEILEDSRSPTELRDSEEYAEIQERMEEIEGEIEGENAGVKRLRRI